MDENEWGTSEVLEGRVAVPFLEHEGEYWGTPATDEIALRELKRLRDEGAGFLVMTWPAFWWPEHYPQFTGEVRRRFPCLYEGDDLVVYDLRD